MDKQIIKALEIAHTAEALGEEPTNVWIYNDQGEHFQTQADRELPEKKYSAEQVAEMMDTLEHETVFFLPDNGREDLNK